MIRRPPYGMDTEINQVSTVEQYRSDCGGSPFTPFKTAHITEPFGRPACYVKSAKPCGVCPYKEDCANAEGR